VKLRHPERRLKQTTRLSTTPVHPLTTLDDVRHARSVIGSRLHRTPVQRSTFLSTATRARVVLKLELFQKTGSFKPRGVLVALNALTDAQRRSGVITLSAGNHAQAVAWAARTLGVRCTVVMPAGAVRTKVEATRGYGGEVILTGDDLLAVTMELQRQRNLTLIHPFDDPNVIAGHGTLGLELLEDVPDCEVVVVGCGGGGLLSGVAAVVKTMRPGSTVFGVEPTGAPGMRRSLDQGRPVRLESTSTIADGLAAPFIGALTYAHTRAFVDDVVLVDDSEIVGAMKTLMERCKVLAEPAASAATAALLTGRVPIPEGASVAVIVSGGNLDLERLKTML
jgi:threonine dehydratase